MKKLLFFYPSNKRTVSLETLFRELKYKGYQINMLSMCERGDLHVELEKYGIKTYAYKLEKRNALIFYLKQMLHLITFCRKNQVEVIFSHLQMANLVAVFAGFFIRSKLVVFRHHDFSRTKNEAIGDKIINMLAKIIIIPSTGVRNLMLQNENVRADKLLLIPYIYDFSTYEYPNWDEVANLRDCYIKSDKTLLLIMVARLVPAKRHAVVLQVLNQMIGEGYDLQLLVLDEGPEKANLVKKVREFELEGHVHFIGFTHQVTQYLAAAELMIHPSYSEASNSAVKEAGLLGRTVAVCENVGDFSDYIESGVNGYLMNKNDPGSELKSIIKEIYLDRTLVKKLGNNLKKTVTERFSLSESILDQYIHLIEKASYSLPLYANN